MVLGFVRYPVVEVEPKYKKLADAIRKGCQRYPLQAFGDYYKDIESSFVPSACVLGAAKGGGYHLDQIPPIIRLRMAFKNDIRKWKRERIADWLETL